MTHKIYYPPYKKNSFIVEIIIIVLAFSFVIAIWIIQSYFEARSFERVTGKHVSVWDAMWVDLKVQENTK